MTERQLKMLGVFYGVAIVVNTLLVIDACYIRNFNTAIWVVLTSCWMWICYVTLRENKRLLRDKHDLTALLYGQHSLMKREIQKEREAKKGNEDGGQGKSH